MGRYSEYMRDTYYKTVVFVVALAAWQMAGVKSMRCERQLADDDGASSSTVFNLRTVPGEQILKYEKQTGEKWLLPDRTTLPVIWESEDGQRVVAHWIAGDYGRNEGRWSPLYVLDVDFGRPRFRIEGHGGFADFASQVGPSKWRYECQRLD